MPGNTASALKSQSLVESAGFADEVWVGFDNLASTRGVEILCIDTASNQMLPVILCSNPYVPAETRRIFCAVQSAGTRTLKENSRHSLEPRKRPLSPSTLGVGDWQRTTQLSPPWESRLSTRALPATR